MDRRRLLELIDRFPAAHLTVVGDLIVDHYLWGQVQRISPEAPVPVVEVREESRRPGGAANVANNISALGGAASMAGVVGDDADGAWLTAELGARKIGTGCIVRAGNRPTTVKTRVVAQHQQVVRIDRESREHLSAAHLAALKRHLQESVPAGGVVVVSDYGKGVVTRALLDLLRRQTTSEGWRVLVDPKSRHFALYRGFALVTPNQREAELASGIEITDEGSLKRAATKLLGTLGSEALLITRGEHGMSLFEGRRVVHIPTAAREVFDVTGAGDTVLAVLALAVAAGATFPEAARLANLAAGIVVGEVGTSTVTPEELRGAVMGEVDHA